MRLHFKGLIYTEQCDAQPFLAMLLYRLYNLLDITAVNTSVVCL